MVKTTGNERTRPAIRRHIDVDVPPIVEGTMPVEEGGRDMLSEIVEAASGKRTRAEILAQSEFSINRIGPSL